MGKRITNKAHTEQKKGNNNHHNRSKQIESKRKIQNINNTLSKFFEKINMIDEPLTKFTKKKNRTQINKIRSEKEVTPDTKQIRGLLKTL